jgi:AcrR family transcriptional regulator
LTVDQVNDRSATHTRKRVIEAARKVFCDNGYREATVRDIASRADLSIGGVYLHFKSKRALYLELVEEQVKDFEQRIDSLPTEDPVAAVKSYIRSNIEYGLKKKRLWLHHLKDSDLKFLEPTRRAFFNSQKKLLEDILDCGEKKGLFAFDDREGIALVILYTIRGAIVSHLTSQAGWLSRLEDVLCSMILAIAKRAQ